MIEIKVLGSGCKKCHQLEKNVKEALEGIELEVEVEYVQEIQRIISYGVMSTPALVIDGEVVSVGKVLAPKEVLQLLENQQKI